MTDLTREQALATLDEGDRAVQAVAAGLADDELERPATIGDGDWSAKDLLGHLTQWEEFALEAIDAWRRGDAPFVEATPKGVDELNAQAVAAKADRSPQDIRAEAREIHASLVSALRGISDDEWRSPPPFDTGDNRTLSAFLGGVLGAPQRPFGHAYAHLADLEAFARSVRSRA
jgi:uncharacterized protein (TIGR03083 family)